ncbi:YfiR family protein [Pseudomonas stutzeri]|uniref:YfiR family protein n=1 Tax=Stutzerimonas stutzeri TaxID=316 RepID=UPI00210C0BFA|nr:YfiR family protein [Stutzerimonas stutzeri]MCQ4313236.1 YfiR family protein [Stutzerimonas stutzeri]
MPCSFFQRDRNPSLRARPFALGALAVLMWASLNGLAFAAADEYDIKAAFLLNFADYVEWPAGSGPRPDAPVRICLVGVDPFGARIDRLLAARSTAKRALILHRIDLPTAAQGCHIAFVNPPQPSMAKGYLQRLPAGAILTVGEGAAFADDGMIALHMVQGRVRLIINLAQARREQIQLSSRLLSLAQVRE